MPDGVSSDMMSYNIQPPLQYNRIKHSDSHNYTTGHVPIKPMYAARSGQHSANKGGNRRQVIQQIIHNNGSGNILFSGHNMT